MRYLFIFILCIVPAYTFAQTIDIPDVNFLDRLISEGVDLNEDGLIQQEEADVVTHLFLSNNTPKIQDLTGIDNFKFLESLRCNKNSLSTFEGFELPLLTRLECSQNELTSLDLTNFPQLDFLDCSVNNLETLDVQANVSLKYLDCSFNSLAQIDLKNNTVLYTINCSKNKFVELDLSEQSMINSIKCHDNFLVSLVFEENPHLELLECQNNKLPILKLKNLPALYKLICSDNVLDELTIENCPEITQLICGDNNLSELSLTGMTKLNTLSCSKNNLSSLQVMSNTLLKEFYCQNNELEILDLSSNTSLEKLNCSSNQIQSLNLENNPLAFDISCQFNELTELAFSPNAQVQFLNCSSNQLHSVDVSSCSNLIDFKCTYNNIQAFDFSNNPVLTRLHIKNNRLTNLNLKNGSLLDFLSIDGSESNLHICADEDEIELLKVQLSDNEILSYQMFTNCAFSDFLGDKNNTLFAEVKTSIGMDCQDGQMMVGPLTFQIESSSEKYQSLSISNDGLYKVSIPNGLANIYPSLFDNDIYSLIPDNVQTNLSGFDTIYQEFCFAAQGVSLVDTDIQILPIGNAQPGFESKYKVTIKNQGSAESSGSIQLHFPDEVLEFVSSEIALSHTPGMLSYEYTNLKPFESREFCVFFLSNSPQDDPPLNTGDIIKISGHIYPIEDDVDRTDNYTLICQELINSYDPNDKLLLQSEFILDTLLGNYVDYRIRFENTGSANAVNVILEDEINPSIFDINSLQIIESSHAMNTYIRNNTLLFTFEDIQLGFNDDNNDGYVFFQIKTLEDLAVGDSILNQANIYFDYNFPIQTNESIGVVVTDMDGDGFHNLEDCNDGDASINPASMEIGGNDIDEDCDGEILSVFSLGGSSIEIFPNPVIDELNIKVDGNLDYLVEIFDINGRLQNQESNVLSMDVSDYAPGNYLVKITNLSTNEFFVDKYVLIR